jgi:hypothetical protein
MDIRLWSDRKDAAVKVVTGVVIVTTWIAVAINASTIFTDGPPNNARQEVLSARSPASVVTPDPAPLPTATPSRGEPPIAHPDLVQPAAIHENGPGNEAPLNQPVVAQTAPSLANSEDNHRIPGPDQGTSVNYYPVSGSRFLPRVIEISGAQPGTTFSFIYRSPNGIDRPLLDARSSPIILAADRPGTIRISLLPASAFASISRGPWTMIICSIGNGPCFSMVTIINDGDAKIVQKNIGSR